LLILAFESSAKSASCALLRDGALLAEYFQNSGQTHSRTLTQMAEDMLRNCDLTARDVDAVACAAGPGSFTGVRIGVAAAKGFAWARQLPCCGISTLEAMAWLLTDRDAILVPVMDARRSQVYNAIFEGGEGAPKRLTPDRAIAIEELAADLEKLQKTKIFVGDGALLCYNALEKKLEGLKLLPEHLRWQRASGVALAAEAKLSAGEVCDAAALTPNYLRLSQAERERLARLQGQ
jgi:tRNA threonylcarbamoyladenosine biosynthesis protein TsaB